MSSNHKHLTTAFTYDYYHKLLQQSSFIEQQLSNFSSKLSKYISSDHDYQNKQFTIKDMQDLHDKVADLKSRIKEKIERQCSIMSQVVNCIKKVSQEYKLLIDIFKAEEQRSLRNLKDLQSQLRIKEIDISIHQEGYQRQKMIILKQQWRKLHYIGHKVIDTQQIPGLAYLKILKDIKSKIQDQLAYEKKQTNILNYKINCKLRDFKIKLLNIWYLLPYFSKEFSKEQYTFGYQTLNKNSSNKIKQDVQQLYLKKQRQIDEFKVSKLSDIKKKLKLLQEADMSQSQQFLSCKKFVNGDSKSLNNQIDESSVVELLRS